MTGEEPAVDGWCQQAILQRVPRIKNGAHKTRIDNIDYLVYLRALTFALK